MPYSSQTHRRAGAPQIEAPAKHATMQSVSPTLASPGVGTDSRPPSIDSLPNEILHKILWESLELNLIRTCASIGNRLPSFIDTARELVLSAFCRVDVAWQLHIDHQLICRWLGESFPLSDNARKKLQKRVLESGWLSINMLKLAMRETSEAYVQEYWVDAGIMTLPPFEAAFEGRWLGSDDPLGRSIELYGVEPSGAATSLIMKDPFYIELNCVDGIDLDKVDFFSVLEVDFIPDRFLELPIADFKMRFLHFLWRSQAGSVAWRVKYSEPVMRRSIQHAIATSKMELTCLLIDLRFHSAAKVTAEDFLTAAKYDHAKILEILVDFDSEDFPRTDPNMEKWARAAQRKGSHFGCTLLEYMQAGKVVPDRHSFQKFRHEMDCGPLSTPHVSTIWNMARAVISKLSDRLGLDYGIWMSG